MLVNSANENSASPTKNSELKLVKDHYKFIKVLGRGSYGEVWLVSPLESKAGNRTKLRRCVLKRLCLGPSGASQNDLAGAEREAQLLSSLNHPNIVAYIESFRSRDNYLNIVMSFCEGGDLYTKLKLRKRQLLDEDQIVEWFIQITLALQYMHEQSILHRDLKTQNIFLTKQDLVKVGDLGIARILDNNGADLATTVIGTPYYMSPEIFSNQPYGQKSDVWALGCCVYEMATLEHAFKAGDINSLVLKIIRGQTPTPPSASVYSAQLTELIYAMLDKDAGKRPTAKQLLQHPYVKPHIARLFEKTKKRCQQQQLTTPVQGKTSPHPLELPEAESSSFLASSQDSDRHSMPPTPKPRISLLVQSDDNTREKSQSPVPPLSQPRARRLQQKSTSTQSDPPESPIPVINVAKDKDEEATGPINQRFLDKIRQNDTLARFRRESPSPSKVNQSDNNNNSRFMLSARQRRREQRFNSSINPLEDDTDQANVAHPVVLDRSVSTDSQVDAIEQQRKAEQDMDDLLFQLNATLRLPALDPSRSISGNPTTECDRTMITTTKLEERRDALRENCLREMTPKELQCVLDIIDRVGETEIKESMIDILGEEIYEKYCAQIYSLKFYEDSLHTRQ